MEEERASNAYGPKERRAPPNVSLADLIDQVPAIVYVDTADPGVQVGHRTTYLSEGVRTLVGYEPAEILDDPDQWLGIVHPDDIEALLERTRRHLAEPSTRSSEYRLIHRDGRVLTVRDDCTSRRDPATGQISSRGVITDISALRASEESFRAFLERLPIVAYSEAPEDERPFLYVGPEIERLTGYAPADFFADDRLFERLVHPDDRSRQLEGYGVPDAPYLAEYRLIHRDGQTKWVRDQAVTELDASGAVTAIHGFLIDITAERETAAALDAVGTRYQRLVENQPAVTYLALAEPTAAGDEEVLYVSPQIESMLGYPAERYVEDPRFFRERVHPDDVGRVYADWLADPLSPTVCEYRLIAADGSVVWVRDVTGTIPGRPGGPDLRQGTLTDITEARTAQHALAAAEVRYRNLVERLPLVTYVAGTDRAELDGYPTLYISPQVEQLLGVKPGAFTDDPHLWRRMTHPDDVERAFAPFPPGASEDLLEYRMIRADGQTIWVRVGARVVEDPASGQKVLQGYVIDITTSKRAEEALVRTQKLESLGNLAGGIAHDFNNLLVSILGNAELALLDLHGDHRARDSILQVEVAARRAAELARQMLAYSGRGQFVVQPVSVNEIVSEIADLLRVAMGKGVGLSLHLADDLPAVEADATQLRQVVMNVVVNASDAIGAADGQITIATARSTLGLEEIGRLHATVDIEPGEYVEIEISDTGAGMDPGTLRRVFDPFFTTKFAGRGLGLAAVLGIVSGHRGGISVESQRGRGSRFRVYLPPTDLAIPAIPEPTRPAPDRSGTILVTDDEPSVRTVARRMLERAGWTVEEVTNGAEAVDRVAGIDRTAPPVDAVLLDLTMPVLDGEQALRKIRELRPGLPVVLMSGYTESEAIQRLGGSGVAGFIQKPFTPEQLATALDDAIAAAARR